MSPELERRIAALRHHKMSPEEVFEQRVSFVWSGQADGPHAKSKDEVRQMLAQGQGRPGPDWRPIESAPKTGERILLWTDTKASEEDRRYIEEWDATEHFACAQFARWSDKRQEWDKELIGGATHWMPSPSAPIAGE